jgi:hypothetical protein
MLGSEVGPQVHDLPSPEADQQHGGADAKPLDARVGALVRVPQLLLACAEVVHLGDDLGDGLLDAAEVGLDGLQLLGGLDGGPVLGVGTDVDVELNVARGDGGSAWRGVSTTGAARDRMVTLWQEMEEKTYRSGGSQSRHRRRHRRAR